MESMSSTIVLKNLLLDPKNRELFGRFIKKYQNRIERCCERYCKKYDLQDADLQDLTSMILLRFCSGDVFDHFVFQTKIQFYAWLDRIVLNDVRMFLRSRSRKLEAWSVGNTDAQDALNTVSEEMVRDMKAVCDLDLERVEAGYLQVKQRIDGQTWEVFSQLVFEGCAVESAMQRFSMNKNAVYAAKARVKRMLREELSDLLDLANVEE